MCWRTGGGGGGGGGEGEQASCLVAKQAVEFPQVLASLHTNTLSRRPTMTTVRSNDTLVDTPFQLISGFFHVNQGVLCCV